MFGTLKSVNDAVFDGMDVLNPFVSKLNDTHKEMTKVLFHSGYDEKQIKDFIDVSRTQFDEWIALEIEVQKRVDAQIKANKEK